MKLAPELSAAKRAACVCILGAVLGACQSLAPDRSAALSRELAEAIRAAGSPSVSERERRQAAAVHRERLAATLPSRLAESVAPGPAALGAVPRAERSGIADPGDFDHIAPARPVREDGAGTSPATGAIAAARPVRESRPGLHRAGLGLPVVGRLAPDGNPNAPEAGFKVPLTLAALPPEDGRDCCDSVLLDPRRIDRLKTAHGEVSLAMDLEASLRAADATGPRFGAGIANLLRPGLFAGHPRILFLEPFDPDRRPLVLVHGLLSTHRVWTPLLLDLLTDPLIRATYQIWFFYYPTGQPVPLSALQLREALDEVAARWRPRYPMVLVGHSMGGILARAQVSRIGPDAADRILPGVGGLPADSRVRRALRFEPRRDVSRAVFMFTPHQGSRLASGGLGAWGIRLIRLPGTLAEEIANALDTLTGAETGRIPTSIHGLSPDSLFLRILHATRPQVPVHSIMGDRGRGDGWAGSDGVVPYISSHLSFAQSEVVVPTGHGGFDHPRAVAELKRILRLELARPDQAQIAPDVATEEIGTQGIVDLVNRR